MKTQLRAVVVAGLLLAGGLGGCASSDGKPAASAKSQLFEGMGPHKRQVSTASTQAQAYFNQGLTWTFAFNHDEAVRSFEQAAALDPNLAAAWWGVALVHGPHINNPVMTEERSRLAWEALQKAQTLKGGASAVERVLIEALGARYAWPAPASRADLDQAYAAAMQRVHEQFPDDLDVTTLYAESLMDLQPWDFWTKAGEPKGRTLEIVTLLEKVLAVNPRHPGAAHYYIHAVEASKDPGRADAAADVLRSLVPASGHLCHMPSHIDVRVGRWPQSAVANRRAAATDAEYRMLSPRQGLYHIYMLHNQQFLSFTCMMMGRSEEAIAAGQAAVTTIPADWVKANPVADGYMTVHIDALKRFGKWDELLAMEAPPGHLPYTTAIWRYARGVALAAQGKVEDAEQEMLRFDEACKSVPEGAVVQINPAATVLALARHVLTGEIAYARKDYAAAETALRAAIELEDGLQYMEPPDWMQPVRHTLGAVLLDAGRATDAEAVYREDLERWPENGWSLLGLANALEAQGKEAESSQSRARFEAAWANADVRPHASCLCAPEPVKHEE